MPLNYEIVCDPDKNGSGMYYVRWRENGKPKRASLRTKDEADVQEKYIEFLRGVGKSPEPTNGTEHTVSDCWGVYSKEKLAKGRSERGATYKWNAFLKPFFGHLTVPQVTKSVIRKYVEQRTTGKLASDKGKVVESTVRGELVLLKSCLNFCAAFEDDDDVPMLAPGKIRNFGELPFEGKPRDRWLEKDEIERLHDAARLRRGPDGKIARIEIFLHLALGTAGREQAIYDLTYGRINYTTEAINLDDGERLPGDKGRAVVYMDPSLATFLKQAEAESDQSIPRERRLVMINKASVWSTLQRVVYDAGLAPEGYKLPTRYEQPKKTGISPHILRHTAATHMAIEGIPLTHIAWFLGNSVAMVEKVYAKHQPQHLKAAAAVMRRPSRLRLVQPKVGEVA